MRTVGMGVLPENEEDQKLLAEIAGLKNENVTLKQELAELKAEKRPAKKGRADMTAEESVEA